MFFTSGEIKKNGKSRERRKIFMIFYFNSKGRCLFAVEEDIYQGSNKASEIYFFCSTARYNVVDVAFTLPSGKTTEKIPLELVNDGNVLPIFDNTWSVYNLWRVDVPASLTNESGNVAVQFFITEPTGKVMATATQTFKVKGGIIPTDHEQEDVYQIIRTQMSKIETNANSAKAMVALKVATRSASDDRMHVYTFSKDGNGEALVSGELPVQGEIAGYDENGNIKTGAPVSIFDAINKEYADQNLASKIEVLVDSNTYVVTINLKNLSGETVSTATIDLPLESVVTSASFSEETEELILLLQSGEEIKVKIGSLISGLVNKRTNDGKDIELYAYSGSEQMSVRLSKEGVENTIATYGENGTLKVGDATDSAHAVNKGYVDGAFGMRIMEDYENTDVSVTVQGGTEYYFGALAGLSLSFGEGNVGDTFYITFKSGDTSTQVEVDDRNAVIIAPIECSENVTVEISGIKTLDNWNVCWREI